MYGTFTSCVVQLNANTYVCDMCVLLLAIAWLFSGKGWTQWKEGVHLAAHTHSIKLKHPLDCTFPWTLNNMCCTFCGLWNVQTIWVCIRAQEDPFTLVAWIDYSFIPEWSPCGGTPFSVRVSSVNSVWAPIHLINTQPFNCWYSWALSAV